VRQVVTIGPKAMRLQEAARPVAGVGEALIRVEAVGLCGSDYHLYDGTHPYARFPQVQGHEFVGVVESIDAGPTASVCVGDRVAVEPLIACGHCFPCRRGRYNCCVNLQVMGAHTGGALAEFIVVAVGQLYPVGDLPPLTAVRTEPVSIGLQCIVRADVARDDLVVVIGAGPIGQAAALAAVDRGAQVLVADQVASRLKRAAELGATRTVDTTSEDLAWAVAEFTGGDGPAVVVEATGVPALIRTAVDLVAHSGTVVVVGISTDAVSIPVTEFSRKELSILGSRNSAGIFGDAVALVRRHADRVSALVTHTFDLSAVAEAIEFARHNPGLVEKVVITMTEPVQ
jgi:L-gulonate 5-dehydrogenase